MSKLGSGVFIAGDMLARVVRYFSRSNPGTCSGISCGERVSSGLLNSQAADQDVPDAAYIPGSPLHVQDD